jgi:hypothetical protein
MAKGVFNASVFTGRPLYPSSVSTLVTVYDADTGLPVPTLWLDRDGVSELSNPHALSEEGVILFYADPGRYNIKVSLGLSLVREWPDVIISDAATSGGGGGGTWGSLTGTITAQSDLVTYIDYEPVTETTTARTLALTDAHKFIYCTNAAGCAITVPPQSAVTWMANTTLLGVGSLDNCTFVEGLGVTIIKPVDRILECYAGSEWALRRLSSDVWALTGYLVAS